jgi:hypothetical protein
MKKEKEILEDKLQLFRTLKIVEGVTYTFETLAKDIMEAESIFKQQVKEFLELKQK